MKILSKAMAKADGNLSLNDISLTEDNPEGCEYYSINRPQPLFIFP